MKKILILLLAAAMLLPCVSAFAAQGDLTLVSDRDSGTEYNSSFCAVLDGRFYLADWQVGRLFCIRPGETGFTVIPVEHEEEKEENTDSEVLAFFSSGEELYTVRYTYQYAWDDENYSSQAQDFVLYRIVLSDDEEEAKLEEVCELDWPTESYGDDYEWPITPQGAAANGSKLLIQYYDDDTGNGRVALIDLEEGDWLDVDAAFTDIAGIAPYEDGFLLLDCSYDTQMQQFYSLDAESGEAEMIAEAEMVNYSRFGGLAWDGENLYYAKEGMLYRAAGFDFENTVQICDMPGDIWSVNPGMLTEGPYYAQASYDVFVIRNANEQVRPQEKMVIATPYRYDNAVTGAYYRFINAHGDVDAYLTESGDQIVENMMNRDSSVDVYILSGDSPEFGTLYDRGYMPEIASETLKESAAEMYEVYRQACMRDGKLICYPVRAYGDSLISLNLKAFEKIGISPDEIPTDVTGFIHFLETLPDRLEESDIRLTEMYYTQDDFRQNLFYSTITTYLDECGRMDRMEDGFMNEDLRAALNAVMDLDLAALGLPEEFNWEEGPVSETEENSEVLIQNWSSYMLSDMSGWRSPFTAWPLSVRGDCAPAYPVNAVFAFMNPFSQKKELAVQFLENIPSAMNKSTQYTFSPKDNEPVRGSWYEENMKYYDESIAETEKMIAESKSAEEKRELEEQLENLKQWREESESYSWEVSREGIDSYTAIADRLFIRRSNVLFSNGDGEIFEAMFQAAQGEISVDEFLRQADKKTQMMILEGK